jgi:hypothetical protein
MLKREQRPSASLILRTIAWNLIDCPTWNALVQVIVETNVNLQTIRSKEKPQNPDAVHKIRFFVSPCAGNRGFVVPVANKTA